MTKLTDEKIDEVIVKVWDMSSASQETLQWARKELRQLFPQPLTNEDLRVKLHNIIFLQKSEDATELLDRIMEALPQPLDDKDWREEIADFIEKMPFSQKPTRNWCEFTADQILALLPSIEEARKRGIREAIDNLKKHHCIVDVEARIKEIENDKL